MTSHLRIKKIGKQLKIDQIKVILFFTRSGHTDVSLVLKQWLWNNYGFTYYLHACIQVLYISALWSLVTY